MRDVVAELRRLELGARIAARLLELGDDVAQRRLADVARRRTSTRSILSTSSWLPTSARQLDAEVGRHPLDERVALGVHRATRRAGARRRGCAGSRRPARTPWARGPGRRAAARATRTRRCASRCSDDLLRERRADAGDVAEQLRARGVELDADVVDAALDDVVELLARAAAGGRRAGTGRRRSTSGRS